MRRGAVYFSDEYAVLVFRDQELDPESHIAFTRRFGEVHIYPDLKFPEHPELALIANMRKGRMDDGSVRRVTEVWHPDSTWLERPPSHAILAARGLMGVDHGRRKGRVGLGHRFVAGGGAHLALGHRIIIAISGSR